MARGGFYASNPAKHGNRWRVDTRSPDPDSPRGCKVERHSFATRDEAEAFRDEFLKAADGKTVSIALDEYLDTVKGRGRPDITVRTLRNSIGRLVNRLPVKVDAVTPHRCSRAYAELTEACAVDTHQNSLRDTKAMWRWLVGGKPTPWDHVKPVGERVRGKDQLTIDESRRFLAACLESSELGALASAICLCLALRAGEVVALAGRDIDDGGRVLWVWKGKTRSARRALEIPAVLQARLVAASRRAGGLGRLFPFSRGWVGYWVGEMCVAANVSKVPPHGLRGTHATIAATAGETAHVVATALGHAGPAVTREHYFAPGAEEAATARALGARLGNGAVRSLPKTSQPRPTGRN